MSLGSCQSTGVPLACLPLDFLSSAKTEKLSMRMTERHTALVSDWHFITIVPPSLLRSSPTDLCSFIQIGCHFMPPPKSPRGGARTEAARPVVSVLGLPARAAISLYRGESESLRWRLTKRKAR